MNAVSFNLQNTPFKAVRRQPLRMALMVLLLTLSVSGMTGCDSHTATDKVNTEVVNSSVLRTEIERGPVKLTVEVSPEEPRLSDEPQLTLTIRSEPGVRIVKPPFGQAMGDFVIRDFHEPVADIDDGAEVIQQVYTLEPTRAGRLTIAPIAVHFQDERDGRDKQEHTIESEALIVKVSSVLVEDIPFLTDLKPAAAPIELPATYATDWIWAGVGIFALVVSGIVVGLIRRGRTVGERKLTPEELAQLELERIVDEKIAESNVKVFYVELTGVVRRYIERSTGVNAPDLTTEEFLRQIVDDALFADQDQVRLRGFLEAADLVKFAAFEPDTSDIDSSIERAKQFIQLQRDASSEAIV